MLLVALFLPGFISSGGALLATIGPGAKALVDALTLIVVPTVFVAIALLRTRSLGVDNPFGLRRLGAWTQVGLGCLVGVLVLVSNAVFTAVSTFVAGWWMGPEAARSLSHTEQARSAALFAQDTPLWTLIYLAVVLVVVTPVAEELFFRGYLYAALRSRWGRPASLLVSAAVFSVFHFYIIQLLPIFVAGLLFALLYEHRGSLVAPVVAHALVNGIVVVLLFVQTVQG